MSTTKLYGNWGSPFCSRVEIALKLKGIPYQHIEEDLKNKSEELLQYNPIHEKIPILLHNGKPIAESMVIIEYIDETWKENPILPTKPYERATARFWAKFIDEKCLLPLWTACWSSGEKRDKAVEESHRNLQTLENHLQHKNFFGGDNLGFVDLIAGPFLAHWIIIIQQVSGVQKIIAEDKYPKVCKWIVDFKNHPVVKDCLTSREKLVDHFKAHVDGLKKTQSAKELYQ